MLRDYRLALLKATCSLGTPVIDLLPQLEAVQELTMDGCHYQLSAIGHLIAATALHAAAADRLTDKEVAVFSCDGQSSCGRHDVPCS